MAGIVYPLKEVLDVKIRRVEDQEKVVTEKRRLLALEQDKLKEREKEREVVKDHHQHKLTQLRTEMDQGTTSDKIQQMKAYIKVVKEKLKIEDKKVSDQKEQVTLAEKNVETALKELAQKRLEVDKLQAHKVDWTKAVKRELELKEEDEFNEQGSTIYLMKKKARAKLNESS